MLGGHGDTMVPLTRYSTVAGIPLPDLVKMGWTTPARLDAIVDRTRNGGGEIVGLLKTGRPSTRRPRQRSRWRKAICATRSGCCRLRAWLSGEYGVKDLYVGVPVVIGAKGVERVVEIELNGAERGMFEKSVQAVEGPGRGLQEDCSRSREVIAASGHPMRRRHPARRRRGHSAASTTRPLAPHGMTDAW